ncbi:ribonuclease Y [Candidatus Uhrbacteria bacterium]|nr:ribonuclease Y [Candidatus Uhrbacteria bacterium]
MSLFTIFVTLGFGVGIGFFVAKQLTQKKSKSAEEAITQAETDAKKIIETAQSKEADVMLRAKEKAIKILEEARIEEKKVFEDLKREGAALTEREREFSKKILEIEETKKQAEAQVLKLTEKEKEVEELKETEAKKLEEISGLSKDQALERILHIVENQKKDDLMSRLRNLDAMETEEVERKAKNIIGVAIQRLAASTVSETTTSYVQLPSDEMKGRIIGREGRNIKAIEFLTGCELIVDDTPGMITISGFSPIRRQITKLALEKLIVDGRIHPGRVEEMIEEAKKDLSKEIKKAAEDALYQLGIPVTGIDPKLIQILGRLKYRTSFGQNQLMHSIEVANLAAMIAEELKANVMVCKKGGLFHDIGKAVDHDMQGGHPELGYQIMKKFGFPEEICYQSIGHHEDKPKTLEAVIVKAADAISGARPGARRDSFDLYVKRLEELEAVATSFEGVEKVYAIQAGRELRVFVNPKAMDDFGATKLARDIALKISNDLKTPGDVRVTLIRETRVTEYAR